MVSCTFKNHVYLGCYQCHIIQCDDVNREHATSKFKAIYFIKLTRIQTNSKSQGVNDTKFGV